MTTVKDSVYEVLRSHGVTTVFGNPGYTELPFLSDFPEDFTYVLGLQEASVVSMADGFAQAARTPVLVNLHNAPGLGNAMGAVITAFHNKTPLIITTGQTQRDMMPGEPGFFARDARDIPRPYVKWSHEPSRAEDVPAAFAQAIRIASQAPAGPVYLAIPVDDWSREAAPVPNRRSATRSAPDPLLLAEAAVALDSAKRPVLVIGAGVERADAWATVVALAERTQAEVYAAPNAARFGFPGDHPLWRGPLAFVQKYLAEQLASNDLIVVLGAAVFDYMPSQPGDTIPETARLIQFTDDPEEAAHALAGDAVIGDVGLAIEGLLAATHDGQRSQPPQGTQAEAAKTESVDQAMEILAAHRPANSILTIEISSHMTALFRRLQIKRSGGFYYAGKGGLGYALPCAVGVQLADRSSRVICLIGDGASLYSFQAIWTAVQHKLPVLFLVLNNGGYAVLKASAEFLQQSYPTTPGLDVSGVDFVKLAAGFGCPGERVERVFELGAALDRAFASEGPMLIDLQVDPTVQYLLS